MRLPIILRAALGEPLRAIAERESEHPHGSLFHMMYADHCIDSAGRHLPKPFTIWAKEIGRSIYVQVSLFGIAGQFREQLVEAMLLAMAPSTGGGEDGVTLMWGHKRRRTWPLLDMYWQQQSCFPIPVARQKFGIASITPIVASGGNGAKYDPESVVSGIIWRVGRLALWHNLAVDSEGDKPTQVGSNNGYSVRDVIRARLDPLIRKSRSFGAMQRLEPAFHVSLQIEDCPADFWSALALGTLVHAGYSTSQGFGRYRII